METATVSDEAIGATCDEQGLSFCLALQTRMMAKKYDRRHLANGGARLHLPLIAVSEQLKEGCGATRERDPAELSLFLSIFAPAQIWRNGGEQRNLSFYY